MRWELSTRRVAVANGRRSRRRWNLALAMVTAMLGACSQPLPDADTPAGRLYVAQCGLCHAAYAPGLLTPAMWEIQVARMDEYRRRRGAPPLDAAERKIILDYLRAHAG